MKRHQENCETCVTSKEYLKLNRQWVYMCWLCVALMAAAGAFGGLFLDARTELSECQQALDASVAETVKIEKLAQRLERGR